jgi:hypothetical protein
MGLHGLLQGQLHLTFFSAAAAAAAAAASVRSVIFVWDDRHAVKDFPFFHFRSLVSKPLVGLPDEEQAICKASPYTGQQERRKKNSEMHPFPEWDSNTRSQCSSGQKR